MTTETLLPNNATRLERALEQALRSDLTAAADLVRTVKEDAPDGWLLHLIWEYGLEELLPYLPDPRVALENGLQWQPIRGTPASIHLALSWLGVTAQIEEAAADSANWFEYQISLYTQEAGRVLQESGDLLLNENGQPLGLDFQKVCLIPDIELLKKIIGLAILSAPVGTRLVRFYCDGGTGDDGCNRRRFILDQSDWGDILSDDGGVFVPELGVTLSFCREQSTSAEYSGPGDTHTSHESIEDGWGGLWDDRTWVGGV